MKRYLWLFIAAAALVFSGGCANEGAFTGDGLVRLLLTDQAGPFDQVLVTINEASIHSPKVGWQTLATQDQVDQFMTQPIDLLTLHNVEKIISAQVLPVAMYTQMRLVLDPGATVVVGGQSYPLQVPSGEQTGFKTPMFTVSPGTITYVILDIEADRIVPPSQPGQPYILPPTAISVSLYTGPFGSLSGTVSPPTSQATVAAYYAGTTKSAASTAINPATGAFTIANLLPGQYYVKATAAGYQPFDSRPTLFTVAGGGTVTVPAITLNPAP